MTYQYIEKKLEELEIRIEALEQRPQEVGPMDKLLSAQAVLDMWRQISCRDRTCPYRDEGRCTETFCDFKLFEYEINHMPPVKPQEPKTGHWKAKSFHELYCDNCGFDFDIMRNDFIDKMKYCPNCGCRMVEPQERSEE